MYFSIHLHGFISKSMIKRKDLCLHEVFSHAYLNKFKMTRNVNQKTFIKYKTKTY